jgi:hypothetical protein
METLPVVVNDPILCDAVPAIVTPPLVPLMLPPLLIKSPSRVNKKLDNERTDPLLIVNGEPALNTFAVFMVIVPELSTITPPVATKGVIHSTPVV